MHPTTAMRTKTSVLRHRRHPALSVLLSGILVFTTMSGGRTAAQQPAPQPAAAAPAAPQAPAQQQKPADTTPRFQQETGVTLVSVDVVVRDSSGNVVQGLTAKDFTVREDGKPQRVDTFSFQEIGKGPASTQELNVL